MSCHATVERLLKDALKELDRDPSHNDAIAAIYIQHAYDKLFENPAPFHKMTSYDEASASST
jgi:hypothetical protein